MTRAPHPGVMRHTRSGHCSAKFGFFISMLWAARSKDGLHCCSPIEPAKNTGPPLTTPPSREPFPKSPAPARHNLRSDIVMISQALVDAGAARRGQRLALVLTKLDLIRAAPDSARAESDFEALLSEFKTKFGAVFVAVEPFRIAASPKDDTLPRGTGVADLLTFWIGAAAPPETASAPRPVFARAFSRLTPHEAD